MHVDILDNDLQKFLIGEILYLNPQYGNMLAEFTLTSRDDQPLLLTSKIEWLFRARQEIRRDISSISKLYDFNFGSTYIEHVEKNACDFNQLYIVDGELKVIGRWMDITFWEVPLMYLESQLRREKFLREGGTPPSANEYAEYTRSKIKALHQCDIVESGTRRRFSYEYQRKYIDYCSDLSNFKGTSNVKIASELGLAPYGSVGHELGCGLSAWLGVIKGMQTTLDLIKQQGKSNIALTDTYTTDFFATIFNGYQDYFRILRQDSGNPILIGQKLIDLQKKYKINPNIIFSDALNPDKMLEIYNTFHSQAKLTFGIGTNLSNDLQNWISSYRPPNIIAKLTNLAGKPVIKISDNSNKTVGDSKVVANYLKEINERHS